MKTKKNILIASLIMAVIFQITVVHAQLSPFEAVEKMGRGINLGNTFDAPKEGDWAPAAKESYFKAYANAGFTCVRIPITWHEHTGSTSPYTVEAAFLNRVEEVIGWALKYNLVVVINAHHEHWLKTDYTANNIARVESIWTQVAERFKNKPDNLIFEMMNEPEPMDKTKTDDLNRRLLPIIRRTNPTRNVIFSGSNWANSPNLLAAAIPNDQYLIGYFHSYDPWPFAGEHMGTWGTARDQADMASKFLQVANWSATNNIPIFVGEFGCRVEADYNSRMIYFATYVEEAVKNNFSFAVWDDHGWFKLLNRADTTWDETKDIVVNFGSESPNQLGLEIIDETKIKLTWVNRVTNHQSIVIEKKIGSVFQPIANLDANATEFLDQNLNIGDFYTYRVVAKFDQESNDKISYPRRIHLTSTKRSPYFLSPIDIPGTLEAEDYDIGGELLTYHDSESLNQGEAYRKNEGVDIEERSAGGFQVGWLETGEWLEYTVNVADTGTYTFTFSVASQNGGGKLSVKSGSVSAKTIDIPSTGNWVTLEDVTTQLDLLEGEQIIRLEVVSTPGFNIDKIIIKNNNITAITNIDKEIKMYPNPTSDEVVIMWNQTVKYASVQVINSQGQMLDIIEKKNIQQLSIPIIGAKGIYILKVQLNNEPIQMLKVIKD